jgi:cytochrome c biogenesis protein CcmG/thiol:disulfide interchange protein DsbE
MQTLQDSYRDQGLEVIAINLDKDRALAEAFLKKMNVDFIVAFDELGDSAKDYQLKGMPTSYLIDRDGNLVATHIGFRTKDKPKLEQAVQQLLSQIKN